MSSGATSPRLELKQISKAYGEVLANADIDLCLAPGEIHALLGENGAGKSTLVKIIYGVITPDEGQIFWHGEELSDLSPKLARSLGIGMVFQHFNLFETLTIEENIFLSLEHNKTSKSLSDDIHEISERYGLPINPKRYVHTLSVSERQRVEIIRCLLQNPKVLIMDEPTSVLSPLEIDILFDVLRKLADEGCSILYISHKLAEVRALCDTATILRGGRLVATCIPAEEDDLSLARLMVGEKLAEKSTYESADIGSIIFSICDLSLPRTDPLGCDLHGLNLDLSKGEILGIAGVAGNGQKEFLSALNGEVLCPRGDMIRLNGENVGRVGPQKRKRRGLGFVPEERLGRGAVPEMSLARNTILTGHHNGLVKAGFLRNKAIASFADTITSRFNVKTKDTHAEARMLSGGNLQKFILGREILLKPDVLLLGHPTWGVDVAAAALIREEIRLLAQTGTAVLIVSEDLDQLFDICTSLTVMNEGRLSRTFEISQTNIEEIGLLMTRGFDETEVQNNKAGIRADVDAIDA